MNDSQQPTTASNNPFRSPIAEATLVEGSPNRKVTGNADGLMNIAKRTFLAWEKLRLLYLAICGIVTMVTSLVLFGFNLRFELLFSVVICGIFANLCYFAAPIVDTYFSWIGLPSKAIRIGLFTLGTLFTCVGAVCVLSSLANTI